MISWMLLWTSALLCLESVSTRTVTTIINPGCNPDMCSNASMGFINIVHTTSVGPSDVIHHIWSTGVGAPSLLLAHTSLDANLTIEWEKLINGTPGAIRFTEGPMYAFGIIFNKIWQYVDPEDEGSMSDKMTNVTFCDLSELLWQNISETVMTGDGLHSKALFRTELNTTDFFLRDKKGSLAFELETQGNDGRNDAIPRLLFTSNSSQVRLVLDNLRADNESSRFAVEISVLTSAESLPVDELLFQIETVKSMDDEYTPGVFKSIHLRSNVKEASNLSSFMSWKPVAYTSDDLSVTGSTDAVYYTPINTNLHDQADSVVKAFFQVFTSIENVTMLNISFGTSGDDFYVNNNYTQWTFYYGLGAPGEDQISSLVITVLATGLGLPFLLIILSSVYFGWNKLRKPKDDLLLSRR